MVIVLKAGVAELADALDLGSSSRKGVGVRVPPPAPVFAPSKLRLAVAIKLMMFVIKNIVTNSEDCLGIVE